MRLQAGDVVAEIDEDWGGRLASLRVGDLSLIVPRREDPLLWGAYVMAPWAGRIRNAEFQFEGQTHTLPRRLPEWAIHGTVLDRRATRIDESAAQSARHTIPLGEEWPFAGHLEQEITLREDGLDWTLAVHTDDAPFPASIGWHPWFPRRLARGDEALLEFRAGRVYERGPDGLPTGALVAPGPGPWDDCFIELEGVPTIRWPSALELTLTSDVDHWVIYDEPEDALCVEPWSGPPDALNIAQRRVELGAPLTASFNMRWQRD